MSVSISRSRIFILTSSIEVLAINKVDNDNDDDYNDDDDDDDDDDNGDSNTCCSTIDQFILLNNTRLTFLVFKLRKAEACYCWS